jgi:cytochrome c553
MTASRSAAGGALLSRGALPLWRRRRGASVWASLLGIALGAALSGPAVAGDAAAGRQKAASCTPCHGALGLSTLPNAPNLAGQPEIYVVEQLRAYRSGRRSNEVMGVIAKPLSDREIDDLAAWYGAIRIEAKAPD